MLELASAFGAIIAIGGLLVAFYDKVDKWVRR